MSDPRPAPPEHADRDAPDPVIQALKPLPDPDDDAAWAKIIAGLEERTSATARLVLALEKARTIPPGFLDQMVYASNTAHHVESMLMDQIQAARARTPESASGTAEPVAWMICSIGGTREVTFDKARADEYVDCVAYSVEPLYLHPASPPSVGATPELLECGHPVAGMILNGCRKCGAPNCCWECCRLPEPPSVGDTPSPEWSDSGLCFRDRRNTYDTLHRRGCGHHCTHQSVEDQQQCAVCLAHKNGCPSVQDGILYEVHEFMSDRFTPEPK